MKREELKRVDVVQYGTTVIYVPDGRFYLAKDADRKMLELELALWIARYKVAAGKISAYNRIMSDCRIGEQSRYDKYENKYNKWIRCCNKCAAKVLEIKNKLEN